MYVKNKIKNKKIKKWKEEEKRRKADTGSLAKESKTAR